MHEAECVGNNVGGRLPSPLAGVSTIGQQLQRVAAAAEEAGATPVFMYDVGPPESAIELAEKWFGPGGAVLIP